ncbi:EAL domain-containing protein [Deinococcus sp. ME38]|uniref:EAL domain-containing protein n=1 Tax=Deinococcus sp. ME38 TaxID=3400344 RepID=UPI003B58ECCF
MNFVPVLSLFLVSTAAVRLVYLIVLRGQARLRGPTVNAMLSAGGVLGAGVWCGHLLMLWRHGLPWTPLAEGLTAGSMVLIGVAYVMIQARFAAARALWRSLILVLVLGVMLGVGLFNAGRLTYPPDSAQILLTALLGAWLIAALSINFEPIPDGRSISPLLVRSAGMGLAITVLQVVSQQFLANESSGSVTSASDVYANVIFLLVLGAGLLLTFQLRRVRALNLILKDQSLELRRERDYHLALLESLNDHIVITDAAGQLIGSNESAARLHAQVKTGTFADTWAADHQLYSPDFSRLLKTDEIPLYRALQGHAVDGLLIGVKSGNDQLLMSCRGSAIRDDDNHIVGAIVAMNDVTTRERTAEALQESYRQYSDVIDNINEGLILTDTRGRITLMNTRARELLGLSATSAPRTLQELTQAVVLRGLYGDPEALLSHPYSQVLAGQTSVGEDTSEIVRQDGASLWLHTRVQGIYQDQQLTGTLCVLNDLTDRIQLREQLQRQTLYSPLTNLPTRPQFAVLAAQQMERAPWMVVAVQCPTILELRQSGATKLADALAVCLCRQLTAAFPHAGAQGQIDDLTFLLLLPSGSSIMLDGLAGPHHLLGEQVIARWKAGTALWDGYKPVEEVIEHSVAAASAAQDSAVEPYQDALQVQSRRERHVDVRLRRALATSDFTVAFQPIVDLATGRTRKAEALVRWTDAELGNVPPDQFITRAEQLGQIQVISDLVIRQAIIEAKRASRLLGQPVRISVNLSPLEINAPTFMSRIHQLLEQDAGAAELLTFEVTESAVLSSMSRVLETLQSLRTLGFQLALDDFGTGYSALSMLRTLPFDQLKLDRSFIWGIETDERHLMLTRSIVALAAELNLDVVAEGIENVEQQLLLQTMNCTYGQGYLYSRPVPLIDWISLNPQK